MSQSFHSVNHTERPVQVLPCLVHLTILELPITLDVNRSELQGALSRHHLSGLASFVSLCLGRYKTGEQC